MVLAGGRCVGIEGFVKGVRGKADCWFVGTSVALSWGIGFIEGYANVKVVWTTMEVQAFNSFRFYCSLVFTHNTLCRTVTLTHGIFIEIL